MCNQKLYLATGIFLGLGSQAYAAAKAPLVPVTTYQNPGKRVIQTLPLKPVTIELPNGDARRLGEDFYYSLRNQLINSGNLIVTDDEGLTSQEALQQTSSRTPGDLFWPSVPVEAARIKIKIHAFSFYTGRGGDRMFYGLDERQPPIEGRNEFSAAPPRGERDWFENQFDALGKVPFDSRSGLDLGDGFNINAIFAFLRVKYAQYEAFLRLELELNAPLIHRFERRFIEVSGKGFFFDVVGGYQGWFVGISAARTDALRQAFDQAVNKVTETVEKNIHPLPLVARVDHVLNPGDKLLLGTGLNSGVMPGTQYQLINNPRVTVSVLKTYSSGVLAQWSGTGTAPTFQAGDLFIEKDFPGLLNEESQRVTSNTEPPAFEQYKMKFKTLGPVPEVQPAQISQAEAFGKMLAEFIFLPYRLFRYFQYDQRRTEEPNALPLQADDWQKIARRSQSFHTMGLHKLPLHARQESQGLDQGIPVAIIDSGIDYNHPALHSSIWENPLPALDPSGRRDFWGWDFISGDSKPFDDHYHGTALASLVSAVNPAAKLIPLKIFNPYGVTSSSAIEHAFRYAIDHGAKIILCGWATPMASESLWKGIIEAKKAGIPVVVAAGDQSRYLEMDPRFPAMWADKLDHLIVVGATDENGEYLRGSSFGSKGGSNFDRHRIQIAASAAGVPVAFPYGQYSRLKSSGAAAAVVAGFISFKLLEDSGQLEGAGQDLIQKAHTILKTHSVLRPSLSPFVIDGRFLTLQSPTVSP